MSLVYLEGAFLTDQEAKLPVSDRGFLLGDGAYATIQVREGVPLFLETHLKRLKEQCLSFNLSFMEISTASVYDLIRLNGAEKGIWRLKILVTGGDSPEMHLPKRHGRILMTIRPHAEMARVPLKMVLFPKAYSLCHASFKSLASLNRYYMMQYAKELGFDDAVSLSEKEILLEASFGNLFWVIEKKLFTPSPELSLYFGVTLTNVIKVAKRKGFEIHYVKMPLKSLSEEAFYYRTNTMGGLRPIQQLGEFHFCFNDALDKSLCEGYEELVLEESFALRMN